MLLSRFIKNWCNIHKRRQETTMMEIAPFQKAINKEITIKLLELTDAPALFYTMYTNKHYLYPWLPWVENTKSPIDSKAFIEDSLKKYTRGESIITGIWKGQQLIGCIGFNEIIRSQNKATIGYWLAQHYQGKGIITNTCRLLINYAFDELHLNRVEILCAAQNYKSRAIPKRLGFTEEETLIDFLHLYDKYQDIIRYCMLRENWKNVVM